jgi:alpha-amylase/alpha-mannosidase (GH57 family)
MKHPLYVAFVWHMHQPSYHDVDRNELVLPWVRLHATKDYLHMVEVLEDYPDVHATFNIVPSMVEQLQGYVASTILDRAWEVSLRHPLTDSDKRYIDSLFYSVNRDKFIRAYPRYKQLLRVREEASGDLDLLSETYWRDLIAWFNLAWIDPGWLQRDPSLRAMVAKGSHFTLDDVSLILGKQKEAMGVTLAAYRRLQRRGQVELSVTPYFHPILPLLIDSNCANEPSPWLHLPEMRYQRREDALEQLRLAIAYHDETFQRTPAGLWPSEGAVSQDLVGLLAEVPEIRWMATDEAILARSLGRNIERNGWGYLTDPRFLYQPYWVRSGEHRVAIVFRDHYLSDRIGFAYKDMTGRQASEDLVFRLACIHETVKNDPEPALVSIILDGENCWEHYEQNGETFLRSLYERLSTEPWVRAVTVSEYLNYFSPKVEIPRLATGSWINGNLETWIGEDTQNRGWEYLGRTREALAEAAESGTVSKERLERARRSMMAAEGSDWFWWYYSHNVSDQDDLFDGLFRQHIARVYKELGQAVPAWVSVPIISAVPKLSSRASSGYVHPPMVVGELSPASWARAGYLEPTASTGAMQQGSNLLKRLYFGYDECSLFLRLESHSSLQGYVVDAYICNAGEVPAEAASDAVHRIADVRPLSLAASREIAIRPDRGSADVSQWREASGWVRVESGARVVAAEAVLEAALPLDELGSGLGNSLGISIVLFKDGLVVQRLPEEGEIIIELRHMAEAEAVSA